MQTTIETRFGQNLTVFSELESHNGKTLVTLASGDSGEGFALFPQEARDLAALLIRAANLAEGV